MALKTNWKTGATKLLYTAPGRLF